MTFVPIKKRNTSRNRKRIRVLERRVEYLAERIAEYEQGYMDGDPAWDKAEKGAMEWAIKRTQEWMDTDPLFDVRWVPADGTTLDDLIDLRGVRAWFEDELVEVVAANFARETADRRIVLLTLRPLDSDPERVVRPWGGSGLTLKIDGERVG